MGFPPLGYMVLSEAAHFVLGCSAGLLVYYLTLLTIRFTISRVSIYSGHLYGEGLRSQADGFIHSFCLAAALFTSFISHMLVDYLRLGF
jgi:hypothetical protein